MNLRQGPFAKRKRWKPDWKLLRRLALLAAAIILVTLMVQLASIVRYTFAADGAEAEARRVAAGVLPKGVRVSNAPRQLAQRLVELEGGGSFGEAASGLFMAVRATPNAELTALTLEAGGGLRTTVVGDIPATISGLEQRIEASGLAVEISPLRNVNGRQTAELTVRAR